MLFLLFLNPFAAIVLFLLFVLPTPAPAPAPAPIVITPVVTEPTPVIVEQPIKPVPVIAPKPPVKKSVVAPSIVIVQPPVVVATTTVNITVGSTTIVVGSIPLLTGGTVHAAQTVPVSYLQITNTGSAYASLQGFWLLQTGSASGVAVTGLSTVDDRGGSRGSVGGTEGATTFSGRTAFAPTHSLLAPGEMRLFTIKATLSANVATYLGTDLKLEVSSVESSASVKGIFPIVGTTWTIAP